MTANAFPALLIEADEAGKPRSRLGTLTLGQLPDNDVLVEISHSSVNYKDGLAITGKGRIARRLPMVGGIDLAGVVVESRAPEWKPGDRVIVNGWGLSETQWGGYAKFQRLKPEWLLPLPQAFTPEQAMAIGTAGYTAALCVNALRDWGVIQPGGAPVLVTGAAGGVGSVAVSLLASLGYSVTAATGRPETQAYLRELGASDFVDRAALAAPGKPLQPEQWAGAVDVVGEATLANALAQVVYGGAVAACGLAGGPNLPATVMPFILRGVALLGVDSVMAPRGKREKAWALLAETLNRDHLAAMYRVFPMAELPRLGADIVAGRIRGRVVVEV